MLRPVNIAKDTRDMNTDGISPYENASFKERQWKIVLKGKWRWVAKKKQKTKNLWGSMMSHGQHL